MGGLRAEVANHTRFIYTSFFSLYQQDAKNYKKIILKKTSKSVILSPK
jgi:hypothetical protein